MSVPYSIDLRMKVIEAIREGQSINSLSKNFRLSRATIYAWKKKWCESGSVAPKKPSNGNEFKIKDLAKFEEYVREHPDYTLEEMAKDWGNVSSATISNALRRISYTYKKKLRLQTKR